MNFFHSSGCLSLILKFCLCRERVVKYIRAVRGAFCRKNIFNEGTLTKASALRLRSLQSYVLLRPLSERKHSKECKLSS